MLWPALTRTSFDVDFLRGDGVEQILPKLEVVEHPLQDTRSDQQR
jgi:hypothetical protein